MAKLLPKANLEALSICGVEKALYTGDTPAARSAAKELFAKIRLRLNDALRNSGTMLVASSANRGAALPPVHLASVVSALCHTPGVARVFHRKPSRAMQTSA